MSFHHLIKINYGTLHVTLSLVYLQVFIGDVLQTYCVENLACKPSLHKMTFHNY